MTTTIAGIEFDRHHYDNRGDVLYLSVGQPREPSTAIETPEGHTVEYDEQGNVIGLVLLNVKRTLQSDGELTVSWPQAHLRADALEPALTAA